MPWCPPPEHAEHWKGKVPMDDQDPDNARLEEGKRRYEIRHWQDHVKALQKYWDSKNTNNPRWNMFKDLLVKFTEPKNWHRWHLQHRLMGGIDPSQAYSPNGYQSPLHFALFFGLDLLAEIIRASGPTENLSHEVNMSVPLILARRQPQTLKYLLDQGAPADQEHGGQTILVMILYQAGLEREGREDLLESVKILAQNGAQKQLREAFKISVSQAVEESFPGADAEKHQKMYLETAKALFEKIPSDVGVSKWSELTDAVLSVIDSISANLDRAEYIWRCAEFLGELNPTSNILEGGSRPPPLTTLALLSHDNPKYSKVIFPMIRYVMNTAAKIKKASSNAGDGENIHTDEPGKTSINRYIMSAEIQAASIAAKCRNSELMAVLLENGDALARQKTKNGATMMHLFFSNAYKGGMSEDNVKLFNRLYDTYPDSVNARDGGGRAPLAWAVLHGHKQGVDLLIQRGAIVDHQNDKGDTALHDLSQLTVGEDDNIAILGYLSGAKASMDIQADTGTTAFARAIIYQTPGFIREFLKLIPRNSLGLGWYGKGPVTCALEGQTITPLTSTSAKPMTWGHMGDVVGFGFEYATGKFFFSKNGIAVQVFSGLDTKLRYLPAVSFEAKDGVSCNFGEEEFLFTGWRDSIDNIARSIQTEANAALES
ncbi:hypothetical protein ABW20_dc0102762 [Dactylellina cionopaga]|nr:hypothetical protein ABW20_dc0102762 [Dactylellina cionopaga]